MSFEFRFGGIGGSDKRKIEGQISSSQDGAQTENKEMSGLEAIDAMIDSSPEFTNIGKWGGVTDLEISSKLKSELKGLLRSVTGVKDFNIKLENFVNAVQDDKRIKDQGHRSYIAKIIMDEMSISGTIGARVNAYLKSLETPSA